MTVAVPRRAFIASSAAVAAAPAVVAAPLPCTSVDPVFSAIAAFRRAHTEWLATLDACEAADRAFLNSQLRADLNGNVNDNSMSYNFTPAAGSIFTGPDTDDLGAEFRGDAAHMNPAGLNAHADLWIPKIVAYCTPILLP